MAGNALKTLALLTAIVPFVMLNGVDRAQAATFTGTSTGVWATPDPGSNASPQFSGVNTNTFTWGTPVDGVHANQLIFAGNPFTTDLDVLFQVGSLTYANHTAYAGTVVDSVPLNVTLSFSGAEGFSETFGFDFDLVSTPNVSTDPDANADFVYPIQGTSDRRFQIGDNRYTLSLVGFIQPGSSTPATEFRVLEDATTTAALYGRISPVPEPESVAGLLFIGVLMVLRSQRLTSSPD